MLTPEQRDELRAAAERCAQVEANSAAGDSCWISRVYDKLFNPAAVSDWDTDKRLLSRAALQLLADADALERLRFDVLDTCAHLLSDTPEEYSAALATFGGEAAKALGLVICRVDELEAREERLRDALGNTRQCLLEQGGNNGATAQVLRIADAALAGQPKAGA